ncbi:Hypothetical predicted protein [Paramuricea clavata]|uniref:Uncharacterized protein n=1 Tax=Paramuricea clavata TaxID=317549 RepID=A0A7D9L8I7_PARCT|nr:Hypothetical predicted protein [Paramuricea clavata]
MSEKVKTADVCVQVIKKRGKPKEIQTQLSFMKCNSVATQCGEEKGSYQRKKCDRIGQWTYDKLKEEVLSSKRCVILVPFLINIPSEWSENVTPSFLTDEDFKLLN